MRCTALIVAFGVGAFITVAGQQAQASQYAPAFAPTPQPAMALDPVHAEPRYPYSWRPPWSFRRWSYGSGSFAPRWPDWRRRPAWRYGWTHRAPHDRNRSYGWQQPWPRWRTWPYGGGYRGYAAFPWRDR